MSNYRNRVTASQDQVNALNTKQETVPNALGDECPKLPACVAPQAVSEPLQGTQATRADEVPAGYKRTEVGVIPSDWEIEVLRNIIREFVNGGTPSTKNRAFWSGDIPWITGADIENQTVAVIRRHITEEAVHNSSTSVIAKGNLLIVSRTGVGKLAITPCDIAISQDFTGVIPNREKTRASFLFRYFDFCQQALSKQNQGTSIKGLTRDTLAEVLIPLPSVSEQSAITEVLSDVDRLIGALDALISKKQAVKQAVMKHLLTGRTRLPGFSEAWETTTLEDVAEIKNGATPNTQISAYWNGMIPWCTPTDITATPGKYLLKTERTITAAGLASSAASLLPVGALLLCSRATIGEIKITVSPVCTNQGFKSIVCKEKTSNEFLYYLLLTLKPQMLERAIGSTFLEIGKREVATIELFVPTYAEQCAIAAVLSDMDTEIAVLERRRDKVRVVKQSIMHQLLTGRVRLFEPPNTTNA